ncbi:IS3 family transposase [Brucella sp. H1_1004]|uniref:IS3 family transposase n=1 Tax=Brucella sp. H1_1004 TaxID=3110109 RepID=UPI0039B5BA76
MSLSRLRAFSGVSISGYYAWKRRLPSSRQLDDMIILAQIRNQFVLSRETYGSPRMHVELNEEGIRV